MHLTQEQRARVACLMRGVAFEDVTGREDMTFIHLGNRRVATWNEDEGPVAGPCSVLVDGLPFLACRDESVRLRANIADALRVAPLRLEWIIRAGEREPRRSRERR